MGTSLYRAGGSCLDFEIFLIRALKASVTRCCLKVRELALAARLCSECSCWGRWRQGEGKDFFRGISLLVCSSCLMRTEVPCSRGISSAFLRCDTQSSADNHSPLCVTKTYPKAEHRKQRSVASAAVPCGCFQPAFCRFALGSSQALS